MAKAPGGSVVKSRLHPALGAETTTRLYECFLRDRIDALSTLDGIDRVIAFTPLEARGVIADPRAAFSARSGTSERGRGAPSRSYASCLPPVSSRTPD